MNRSEFIAIDFKRLSEERQNFTGYEDVIIYTDRNDNVLEKHGCQATDLPLDRFEH